MELKWQQAFHSVKPLPELETGRATGEGWMVQPREGSRIGTREQSHQNMPVQVPPRVTCASWPVISSSQRTTPRWRMSSRFLQNSQYKQNKFTVQTNLKLLTCHSSFCLCLLSNVNNPERCPGTAHMRPGWRFGLNTGWEAHFGSLRRMVASPHSHCYTSISQYM